jgi:peptidoglycan hydrolase-like protein with peptidoglycan-binding domain
MRTGRYVAFASVLVALVGASPAQAVLAPHIAGAQVALRAQGLYGGPIDGIAGPKTDRAVRKLQRRERILVDGVVGRQTRSRMGRLGRPLLGKRHIRRGMVGWDVSVVQFLLNRRGIRVGGIDGIYGRATQSAVRHFQAKAALGIDGIVGPVTTRALVSAKVRQPAARGPGASQKKVGAMLGFWARHYGVSPSLVRAVAWMESGWHWNVTSSAGAWGVMQVMPATWRFVENVLAGGRDYRRSARGGIRVGIIFLRHVLGEFGGNRRLALAAYYQGPAAVRRFGLYRETRRYVRVILSLQRRFS